MATVDSILSWLDKFEAEVYRPLLPVFTTCEIAAIGVQPQGVSTPGLVALDFRLTLRAQQSSPVRVAIGNEFFAVRCHRHLGDVRTLCEQILSSGRIDLPEISPQPLYLTRAHAGLETTPPTINLGGIYRRGVEGHDFAIEELRLEYSTMPDHVYLTFGADRMQEISKKLRRLLPPYNGLPGLCKELGLGDGDRNSTHVGIGAWLPFGMKWEEPRVIVTTLLPSANLTLRVFYDSGESQVLELSDPMADGEMLVATASPNWPEEDEEATCYLDFAETEIGSTRLRRWKGTSNWVLAVDDFFDRDGGQFNEALTTRAKSADFEHAIVRLLSLLRVPTVWYGDKTRESATDFVSIVERKGKRLALVGECTLLQPSKKFSVVLERCRALRQERDGIEFIPVVFTAAEPSSTDMDAASQDRIVLVGKGGIETLRKGLYEKWTLDDTVDFLMAKLDVFWFNTHPLSRYRGRL